MRDLRIGCGNDGQGPRLRISCLLLLAATALAGSLRAQTFALVPSLNGTFHAGANAVMSDTEGNVFILDSGSGRVLRVPPNGAAVVYAGGGSITPLPASLGGITSFEAFQLNLAGAEGMRFGADGVLYVSDTAHNRILSITREPSPFFAGVTRLVGRVFAGQGAAAYFGDGALARDAWLNRPKEIVADAAGNLFIADTGNFRVRRIGLDGIITTVAGNGTEGFSGDGGPATEASIHTPRALALDAQGNLYIAMHDAIGENSRVRKVTPQGIISTVAGIGSKGFSGDSGPATSAQLNSPSGLAVDSSNFLYIADSGNQRIRMVTPAGKLFTILHFLDIFPLSIGFTPEGRLLASFVGGGPVYSIANAGEVWLDSVTPPVLNLVPAGGRQRMNITVGRNKFTGSVAFSVTEIPSFLSGGVVSPGTGNEGYLELAAEAGTPPQIGPLVIRAMSLNSEGLVQSQATYVANYNVIPAPTLVVTPTSLQFNGTTGAPNPGTQSLGVRDASGGVLSWSAQATTANGGGWLSISPASGDQFTPLIVFASVQGLSSGTYTGNVLVTSSGANGSPANIPVTLTVTNSIPTISSPGGILNNASYNLASSVLAPGSIAAIFGTNLTNGASCAPPNCGPTLGADGRVGTTLAGAQVSINGVPAPVFYALPTQLGVQIPFELASGTATVRVTVDGRQSEPQTISIDSTAPGIFTVSSDGTGLGAITHADGSAVTTQNPALPDEVLILYATGLGAATPAVPTGARPAGLSTVSAPVSVVVDGIEVSPEFSGLVGCCVGLNQVNFRLPPNARTGAGVTVILRAAGRNSNSVILPVR